jgi:hypothetical protein
VCGRKSPQVPRVSRDVIASQPIRDANFGDLRRLLGKRLKWRLPGRADSELFANGAR